MGVTTNQWAVSHGFHLPELGASVGCLQVIRRAGRGNFVSGESSTQLVRNGFFDHQNLIEKSERRRDDEPRTSP
jgi:hypothetical protein